jgi:lipopolysaccharide export system permease protein
VVFVLLVQFLWKYIDDMVGKGLDTGTILQLVFYMSTTFIPLALPLAVLLSSIMAFGKLAETNELMALKCSGISLLRVMVPLMTVVAFISGMDFYISNNIIPRTNLKAKTLLHDVSAQRPALNIKAGVFFNGIPNYSIYVKRKDKESNKLYDIKIYDHTRENGNDIVMTASSGNMHTSSDKHWLNVHLNDGDRFEEVLPSGRMKSNFPFNRTHFKSYDMKFDLSAFSLSRTNTEVYKDNYEMLNIRQLMYYKDSLMKVTDGFRSNIRAGMIPYFQYARDSAYAMKTNIKTKGLKGKIINTAENVTRKGIIINALMNARNVKSIVDGEGTRVTEFEKYIIHYDIEWHRKFALSLACLTLFLIGAPLGAIIRKGGFGLPVVVAIGMFLLFYVISIIGEKSCKQGVIAPVIGMWLPTMVLLPIGFILTWRANVDKISFNTDGITRFFKSLMPKKKIATL